MISLLLTLFISLFSLGAPINTIEVPKENNITLPSSKSMIDKDGGESYVLATGDFEFYHVYSGILSYLGMDWGYSNADDKSYSHDISYGNVYTLRPNGSTDVDSWAMPDSIYKLTIDKEFLSANSYVSYSIKFWFRSNNVENSYSLDYIIYYNLTEGGRPGYVNPHSLVQSRYLLINGEQYTYWPYNIYFNITAYDDPCFDIFVKPVRDNIDGYQYGYDLGLQDGFENGRQVGYNEGLDMAQGDPTALAIFTGITDIGLLPINVFLKIFEFEVFGINISGLVGGLLTIAVVVIIIRFLLGERNS